MKQDREKERVILLAPLNRFIQSKTFRDALAFSQQETAPLSRALIADGGHTVPEGACVL